MKSIESYIIQFVGGNKIVKSELIQGLWSGYGEIRRYWIDSAVVDSVIVKHVKLPNTPNHPRGWDTDNSHQRKLKSYQIEINWYYSFVTSVEKAPRMPHLYFAHQEANEMFMIIEDLDNAGFFLRKKEVNLSEIKVCLDWLAHFHATYMSTDTNQLWEVGTYWHLATRPDELKRMKYTSLKRLASKIDFKLNNAKYQTLVHGDAKLANFCFSEDNRVAAVDFQYVGKGCGIKDVVYFFSSCLDEEAFKQYENELLDYYFDSLSRVFKVSKIQLDINNIVEEWRSLYKYAWADFYRFLDGWSPGHWKMNDYIYNLTQQVLKELEE